MQLTNWHILRTMKANQTNNKPEPWGRIHQVKPTVTDQKLPDPLPELVGLRGGEKQRWNNSHLDYISDTFELKGPEYTKALFRLSERTLKSVLGRAEKQHRKSYNLADRAINEGRINAVNIHQNEMDISYLADVLFEHIERSESRWNSTANLSQLLSEVYGLYAKALKNEPYDYGKLHNINRANLGSKLSKLENLRTKVNSSCNEVEIPASAGGSVHGESLEQAPGNHRDLIPSKEEPGRLLLPGLQKTRLSPRQRYQQSKARRWRRV